MGENSLLAVSPGDDIDAADPNQYRTALSIDHVPRDLLGAAADAAGSLGTALLQWQNVVFKGNLIQDGSVIDFSALATERHLILSGKETTDGFPDFLEVVPASTTAKILAGGANPDLELLIDGTLLTLTADQTTPSMLVAPSVLNTARADDSEYSDENFTKTEGEMGETFITLKSIGANVSALDGSIQAFSHGAGPEVFFARIDSTNLRFCDAIRGIGGTLREEFSNNDLFTLLAANYIFIQNDLTIFTTRTYPEYLQADPSSPSLGDFYFDTVIKQWKRFNGVSFDTLKVDWLGTAILDDIVTTHVEPNDFDMGWQENLKTRLEFFSITQIRLHIEEASIAGTFHKHNGDQGRLYTLSTNLEPGRSEIANTLYYIYLQDDLTVFFSDLAPRKYDWRRGYYHPRRYWRCVGAVFRDGSGIRNFQKRGNQFLYEQLTSTDSLSTSPTRREDLNIPVIANGMDCFFRLVKVSNISSAFIDFVFRSGLTIKITGAESPPGLLEQDVSLNDTSIQNGTTNYFLSGDSGATASFGIFGYKLDFKNGSV